MDKQFRRKYNVIRHLLRLQEQDADLSPAARLAAHDGVYDASIRLFGSYRQALVEAGINPLAVYQRRIGKLDDMRLHIPNRLADAARVGHIIKRRRTDLRLSQAAAAKRCQLTESAIANYECGLRLPGPDAAVKLSRGLGIPVADLVPDKTTSQRQWMLLYELFTVLSQDDQAAVISYVASLAGSDTTETFD